MKVIMWIGICWTIYGILGLIGIQHIPQKYKGKTWTKDYARSHGLSWLMIGIPWIVLYCILNGKDVPKLNVEVLLVLCGLPSVVYSIFYSRKYSTKLKEESENS